MNTIIFNGRAFAREKESELKKKVRDLKKKGVTPRMAAILTGNDKASRLYLKMKKRAGARVGIKVDIYRISTKRQIGYVLTLMNLINKDKSFHGMMVQLPIYFRYGKYRDTILDRIPEDRDVDGLRKNSKYTPAVALAVGDIVKFAQGQVKLPEEPKVVVVGHKGVAGSAILDHLDGLGYMVEGVDQEYHAKLAMFPKNFIGVTNEADILVTATRGDGIITANLTKVGAAVVDVASPEGNVDSSADGKVGFLTPVPGGVGPVTVACLLENVVKATYNSLETHT